MTEHWYYVQDKNRHGPVEVSFIKKLISNNELSSEDFVWKKGFESWKKVHEVSELFVEEQEDFPPKLDAKDPKKIDRLSELDPNEKKIHILIGLDRGEKPSAYGPYSLSILKRLFEEKRINGKTQVFVQGMQEYRMLADFSDYSELFKEAPPEIKESERRLSLRKPFVARMFFENNKKVFEGICRDISIGGMQVLMDNFKGKAGDRISLNVHPENSDYHFTAAGVVVRLIDADSGFSFRFDNLNDQAKAAILKYLENN